MISRNCFINSAENFCHVYDVEVKLNVNNVSQHITKPVYHPNASFIVLFLSIHDTLPDGSLLAYQDRDHNNCSIRANKRQNHSLTHSSVQARGHKAYSWKRKTWFSATKSAKRFLIWTTPTVRDYGFCTQQQQLDALRLMQFCFGAQTTRGRDPSCSSGVMLRQAVCLSRFVVRRTAWVISACYKQCFARLRFIVAGCCSVCMLLHAPHALPANCLTVYSCRGLIIWAF